MANILTIDDDIQVCETIESLITRLGHESSSAQTLGSGLGLLRRQACDLVFLDIHLPDGNGLAVLPEIMNMPRPPEVIILTGQGDPDGAELAIQQGVWDYMVKPSPIKEISLTLDRALKYRAEKLASLEPVALNLDNIVGTSPGIKNSFNAVAQAAKSMSNVLITGETGTGKELFARTIHDNSTRADKRFVVVDCAALTESLVESTLFGHKKGSFTGAQRDSEGLILAADGGTLFLDEVGEMPLSLQKSFLRVLQERKFRPVGDSNEIHSDFRLISATNKGLTAMVQAGEYRQDLFYRLKTMHLALPPLRERTQDIKPLALYYADKYCERYNLANKGFGPDFFDTLKLYDWPGNIRELFNVLETTLSMAGQEQTVYSMHLPSDIRVSAAKSSLTMDTGTATGVGRSIKDQGPVPPVPDSLLSSPLPDLKNFKADAEKAYLQALLRECDGDVQQILSRSGLSRSHFYALIKKHDITS